MTHTSGLNDEDWAAAIARREPVDVGPPDDTQHPTIHWALACGYGLPPRTPPGTEMNYCTYNYELAGEIVRRVTGRSLEDVLQLRICEPLGMRDTHLVVPKDLAPRIVRRTVAEGDRWPISDFDKESFRSRPWAGAGAYSTAYDMALFGRVFLDGAAPILSRWSVDEMTRNQIPGIGTPGFLPQDAWHKEASWSYAWAITHEAEKWLGFLSPPPGTLWHDGAGVVLLWIDAPRQLIGAFFTVVRRSGAELSYEDLGCCDRFVNVVTAAVED
jgi:CubicO group peptidase (beta-lactamase class C family)